MTTIVRPWYEQLTDGVTALREQAYEYKTAQRTAYGLRDSVDVDRRRIEEGRVHVLPIDTAGGWASRPREFTPHTDALFALSRLYSDMITTTSRSFEDASMLYASGACWAISQVQKGSAPDRVTFERDPQDSRQATPRSLEIVELGRYSETAKLTAAYERLADCLHSGVVGEDMAGRDYLADHEASDLHDAWAHAEGTGAAAYAYGLLAERALRFVLLPVRYAKPATAPTPTVPGQAAPVDPE